MACTRFTLGKPPKGKNPTNFLNIDLPTKNNAYFQERTNKAKDPPLTLDQGRVAHHLTKIYPRNRPRPSECHTQLQQLLPSRLAHSFLVVELVSESTNEALASLINSGLANLKLGMVRPITLPFYFLFYMSRHNRADFYKGTIGPN